MVWATPTKVLSLAILGTAIALTASAATTTEDVPLDIKDKVEASLIANFVRPQTNIWRWDSIKPFLGRDRAVCGAVNFESAGQHYIGYRRFYAIIHENETTHENEVSLSQIENAAEDTTGARERKLKLLCGEK